MEEAPKRLNPFRVMIDPHGFMRSLNAKNNKGHWVIAWLLGTVLLFSKSFALSLGLKKSLGFILLFSLVFGIPAGYLMIYLYSFLLFWTGKIFRGQASFEKVVDAFVWTRVVQVFALIGWITWMALFGKYVFSPLFFNSESYSLIVMGVIGFQFVFRVWEMVILFHTLGEVQKISAWIAIWNVLFAEVLLMIIDGILNWFLSSSVGVGALNLVGAVLYR